MIILAVSVSCWFRLKAVCCCYLLVNIHLGGNSGKLQLVLLVVTVGGRVLIRTINIRSWVWGKRFDFWNLTMKWDLGKCNVCVKLIQRLMFWGSSLLLLVFVFWVCINNCSIWNEMTNWTRIFHFVSVVDDNIINFVLTLFGFLCQWLGVQNLPFELIEQHLCWALLWCCAPEHKPETFHTKTCFSQKCQITLVQRVRISLYLI